jgi:hypothetical protein
MTAPKVKTVCLTIRVVVVVIRDVRHAPMLCSRAAQIAPNYNASTFQIITLFIMCAMGHSGGLKSGFKQGGGDIAFGSLIADLRLYSEDIA